MASRRDQILDAVVAALGAVGKPAGLTVHRFRVRPFQQVGLPAVAVYPLVEELDPARQDGRHGYKARRDFVLRCEVRVAVPSTSSTSTDEALDPLLTWVVRQVMADRTQGRLAHNTTERRTQWDAVEADALYGAASVDFLVEYLTAVGDPDAA